MIVGLGLANKDLVAVVPNWERDAKVAATQFFAQLGGPVPVALATLNRLGNALPTALLGVVGDDAEGDEVRRMLAEEEIDASNVVRAPGIATSVSLALLDARDGSRTLANYAETLPPLALTPAHEDLLRRARLLHLDGRDLPVALAATRIVCDHGGLVSLDLGTMRPGREALFPWCDIVIASRKGGAGAFPDIADDPIGQTRRFLAQGVRAVAGVTLGADGVVIGESGAEPVHLPAHRVSAVRDTCGAGDVFHGAFLWAYLQGERAIAAARFAQAAVALRIQRYGNRDGIPTYAEVEAWAAEGGTRG